MRRRRRAKIIATLGPVSSSREMILNLHKAGADVFRINMSHLPRENVKGLVQLIRSVEDETKRPIGILADLQGPKLRIGNLQNDKFDVNLGQILIFDQDISTPGSSERIPLPHPEIFESVHVGERLLIDDGRVWLEVVEHTPTQIKAKVTAGRVMMSRKGVSLPDTLLKLSALTPKDRSDLDAVLEAGVDWVALSFVQRADDVAEVKKIARGRALVMAKIEKPQAVERLDAILEVADALMVARGDLGVEMPIERVPGIQKRITRLARRFGKPVVVATQMLESMITAPIPTRAEVSDVATAIFEGADAIMLSAESAAGQYPTESVQTMNRIAEEVERDPVYNSILTAQRPEPEATGPDAIATASRSVAETLSLAGIIAWTFSGSTALRVARERPRVPILAMTPQLIVARRLALVWGVHAILTPDISNEEDMVVRSTQLTISEEFAKKGDRIIIIAGTPFGTPGATNMMRLSSI